MQELCDLHNKYHRDGKVKGSTSIDPYIKKLRDEAGSYDYLGDIVEREVE